MRVKSVRPMSCKAVGFADLRSRRRFMSLDGTRASARHHCRRSATCDRMRPCQRHYDERVSPLRSMPDRGEDAAVARSQMRTSTTISSTAVSTRPPPEVGIAILGVRSMREEEEEEDHVPRLSIVIPSEWRSLSRLALPDGNLVEIIFSCF